MEGDDSHELIPPRDRDPAEEQPFLPACRVSRVIAKPGAMAVTLKDLQEQLSSIRGLPTLWEAVQRLFHLQRDEVVVMPLSLLRDCERVAGPSPGCMKGIVGLRDVFILHHRFDGQTLLPEPVARPTASATCDACGARALSHFYSSRESRRTLCPGCYQLRTRQGSLSESGGFGATL